MKKTVRHIAVYLLAGIVTLSSVGLSVHELYCYCKGETMASLFCPTDPCAMDKGDDCCGGGQCVQTDGQPHDCTDCNSKYVHLDVDGLLFPSDFKLNLLSFDFATPSYFVENQTIARQEIEIPTSNSPPRPFGIALLLFIQTFRC